jgi:diguanylate cyclase (GGDEF)-like protein/PAS domain S-box-containing protein
MAPEQRGELVRVLLVEDDEDDYLIARGLLAEAQRTRFELDWAPSFADGAEAIVSRRHDVYLVDYRLGEHDGLELTRRTRAAGDDTPIIILTGQDDPDVDLMAARLGVDDYLVKGRIDALLLERSIRYALESARAVRALRESEERYALAVRGANDGVWDWDIRSETVYFSPRWREMMGLSSDETPGTLDDWLELVHSEDLPLLRQALEAHAEGATPHFEHEHRVRAGDGLERWLLARGIAVRGTDGKAYRMAGSMADITDRKRAEEQLLHDALHDSLTGLPNRALLLDRVERSVSRSGRRPNDRCAVLFLDLDRFKFVNDSLGHATGDRLLVAVAARLQDCVRPGDTVARLGGDEFIVLLDDVAGAIPVHAVADRVHRALADPFELDGQALFVTASIGIAVSGPGSTPSELVRDADIAMYRAKGAGGNRAEVFDRRMHEEVVARMELEAALRAAGDAGTVRLGYQPIVGIADGKVMGFEALLRMTDAQGGPLSPGDLIPIAEETALIVPLGRSVLRTACAQLAAWRRAGLVTPRTTMAVNVSRRQLTDDAIVDDIVEILEETGLEGSALLIEITESAYIAEPETIEVLLSRLRSHGVHSQIDDFGTGYSSLTFLRRCTGAALKIDRSFVADVFEESGMEIVGAICSLAHTLGMDVVAEGVERTDQLDRLRQLGCDWAQGFLFAPALQPDEVAGWLARAGSAAPIAM